MDPPFPDDGQPVRYTNALLPGLGQQSSCLSDYAGIGPFQSSTFQPHSPHHAQTCLLAPASSQSLPQHSHHRGSAYASMTSFPGHLINAHQAWPSPPLSAEEFGSFSYTSSPTSGSSQPFFKPACVSPRTWPAQDQAFSLQQESFSGVRTFTPSSIEDFPVGSYQAFSPYPSTHQGFEGDIGGTPHTPLTMQDFGAGSASSIASPTAAYLDTSPIPDMRTDLSLGSSGHPVNQAGQPATQDADAQAAKVEEPYAQLIYKAFMSKPDHTMTLQEIYQWFRNNTDKDRREGKGWQNSIRHNLSMNAAFTKRERKRTPASASTPGDQASASSTNDPKRSNEWVLEDWAVRDGVQSTTRYRKGNSSRRATGTVTSSKPLPKHSYDAGAQQGHRISTGAVSGRSYGHAAGSSRPSRSRQQHHSHGSTVTPAFAHRGPPVHAPNPIRLATMPGLYGQYHGQDLMIPRTETPSQISVKQEGYHSPLTPEPAPAPESFDMMMSEPGPSQDITSVGGSSANYTVTGRDQGQVYAPPQAYDFPYNLGDVTGIYQEDRHSAASNGNDRIFGTMHDGLPWQ